LRDVFVDQTLGTTDEMDEDHLIDGYAKFISSDTLEVNGQQIKAGSIVIATGSSPVIPAAWNEFADDIFTSDEIFELEELPASVAVIGLGSIGLEIGQALSRLGVEVTGIDQLDVVAQLQDSVVNKCVIDVLSKEFPFVLGTAAQLEKVENGIRVTCGDKEVVVKKVFASLGRKPNLDQLGLEALPIEMDNRGVPVYDPLTMQLGNLPIFIAGDVNSDLAILHEAGHEGRVAGYNAARKEVTAFKRKTKLGITFCDPNIATVGAQLAELNEEDIVIGEMPFGPVSRALIIGKNRGVLRIYVQRSNGKLLGAAMACVKGENLAHLLAWSVQQDLTVFDLLKMPFYHPVIEEALQAVLYSVLGELEIKQDVVELEKA